MFWRAYNIRRSTRDIDAVFEPKATIYQVAARIAQHHGLDRNWLNDSVKGLLPGPDQAPQEVVELPGLRVSVASPRYLLALKVAAARVDRDADDIRFLAGVCGLRSAREILDLTEDIIGRHRPLAAKVQFLVEEIKATVEAGLRQLADDSLIRRHIERLRQPRALDAAALEAARAPRSISGA